MHVDHTRTGEHSMQSILLMQSGPQPSPPRHVGLQWQIMTSSSSWTFRLRCPKALSFMSCHTTGMRFLRCRSSSLSVCNQYGHIWRPRELRRWWHTRGGADCPAMVRSGQNANFENWRPTQYSSNGYRHIHTSSSSASSDSSSLSISSFVSSWGMLQLA